jgi:3-dehydroquinate dehydratase-2
LLASEIEVELTFEQTNDEGEIIDLIQNAVDIFDGIIINAAGYTHTSVAIRDALEIFNGAKIELHISNIFKREDFRHHSYLSNVVDAVISGLGVAGYQIALLAIPKLIESKQSQ